MSVSASTSASMGEKITEADKLIKKANKYWQPSLMDFRLKPDWEAAGPLFEKAALLYKQVGQLEKARAAYERAAQSQENIGSVWHAAKHLEICGAISKDLGQHEQVAEFYRQAGSYFAQAGRISAAADALARGAKALEDKAPAAASALYGEAIEHYESDGKEAQATDVFRQAIALLVKRQAWSDAVGMCMRFGEACDKANARSSQSKAYLGAIVLWLHAGDAQQAWQVFQDVLGINNFTKSDEAFAADALFLAYQSGSAEKVQTVVQGKQSFKQLDNQLARLAVKLPQGDLAGQARALAAAQGGRDPNKSEEQHEEEELL
ncbi:gamma-soluble NSF attachment protein-like protein [Scenedesmus sp. NREL 46B-D3]|nr:gamma-soluble NSF attachment protein-like protein [Scenedesmus sp. NREL 46B-D3]